MTATSEAEGRLYRRPSLAESALSTILTLPASPSPTSRIASAAALYVCSQETNVVRIMNSSAQFKNTV